MYRCRIGYLLCTVAFLLGLFACNRDGGNADELAPVESRSACERLATCGEAFRAAVGPEGAALLETTLASPAAGDERLCESSLTQMIQAIETMGSEVPAECL